MAITMATINDYVGKEIGLSDWVLMDQSRINKFAECTGDNQWIHVDEAKAKHGPFGTTVAHGYLTLAMLAFTGFGVWGASLGAKAGFNYGLDKVRFIAPVKSGAKIRNRIKLIAMEDKGGGRHLMTTENTIEIEGEDKPAMIAVALAMIVT